MARRYVTMTQRSVASDDWYEANAMDCLARTVFQPEPQAIKTGLLDASGDDIYMIDEPAPIGFVRWED